MAITYYTGIPRSGKTLKAVAFIYETFVAPKIDKFSFLDRLIEKANLDKKKENPFKVCYTNINQFNFEIDERIEKLDFDELLINLTILHSMYLDKATDDELIEKSKEFNLLNALFVIDEAHNFFNKKNDVLIWWLSYHGHLYHEIILITQHLNLILKEYTQFTEYFYRAVPQRFRFSKNTFKYIEYSGRELYKNQRLGITNLKVKPEYFNLYVSGAEKKDKPIIYKYIFILIFLIAFALLMFFRFMNNLQDIKEENKKDETVIQNSSNSTDNKISSNDIQKIDLEDKKEIITNLKLFKFNCFDKFCYYKIDKKNTIEIPMNILKSFLINIDEDKKFTEILNNRLYIYALVDENKFNFINKGVTNENEKNNNSILPSMSAINK